VLVGVLQSGAILLTDPTLSEEAASSGRATLFINPHGEICGWQMAEGVGLDQAQMMRCVCGEWGGGMLA
jgi:exosome complex RNA-binding protein Rrp42 (RNase PH superfamily)